MIEITITKEQILRAEMLYKFKALNNSIREGDGNLTGALGEIVVFDYYTKKGCEVEHCQHHDFDLMIQGYTVEIKTKGVNTIPLPDHTCHVSNFNAKQQCEFYCFVNVKNDFTKAWLKGMISRTRFDSIKQLKMKGDFDKNFQFRCDTWIVLNSQLTKIN